jgi:hypothetical protein
MRAREFIPEADDDTFSKYRSLGQKPLSLVKHLAGKVFRSDDKSGRSDDDRFVAPKKFALPKSTAPSINDPRPVRFSLDKVINSQKLDDQDIEQLKQAKVSSTSSKEEKRVLDKILSGDTLDHEHLQVIKHLRHRI